MTANSFEQGNGCWSEDAKPRSGHFASQPPYEAEVAAPLTCAVMLKLLHDEGEKHAAIDAIYLRPDGLEFVMTGSEVSVDMYEHGADVAFRVQRLVDPSGATYVEGGWRREQPPIEGWLVAYSRQR
jgi:hypothetical protein